MGIPVGVGVSKAWAKGKAVWYEGVLEIFDVPVRLDVNSGVQIGFGEGTWGRVDGLLLCVEVEEKSGYSDEKIWEWKFRHWLTKFD